MSQADVCLFVSEDGVAGVLVILDANHNVAKETIWCEVASAYDYSVAVFVPCLYTVPNVVAESQYLSENGEKMPCYPQKIQSIKDGIPREWF